MYRNNQDEYGLRTLFDKKSETFWLQNGACADCIPELIIEFIMPINFLRLILLKRRNFVKTYKNVCLRMSCIFSENTPIDEFFIIRHRRVR